MYFFEFFRLVFVTAPSFLSHFLYSNYGIYLENQLYAAGWDAADVEKVKIWNSGYPKEPEKGYCTISPTRNAVQNDDADQQTSGSSSRDMGDQGCVLIKGCAVENHRSKFSCSLYL